MTTCILWLRRDLRLADNPALEAALDQGQRLLPLYIHAPEEEAPWPPGAASRWWLHHSLAALDRELRARGSALAIRRGPSLETLLELIRISGARRVYWNRCYEPALVARDTMIKVALREADIQCASHNAALLREPWEIRTGAGQPYRVFTPFWRACLKDLPPPAPPPPAPDTLPPVPEGAASLPLEALGLLPRQPWDQGLRVSWRPGEAGAWAALGAFLEDPLEGYGDSRDLLARPGTARLSPHLHFGELSPRQIRWALLTRVAETPRRAPGADAFLRQLGWREFAHHLLFHFPATSDQPLNPRFAHWPWREDPGALAAWQRGETGIPLVDAGMRELWRTGWMHNRARMLTASLLCKNLGLHWREGARWFWDTLVDADLANNGLGWQWSAGCGADAAPYYRIFNPVRQGERFDPRGDYVRRWLSELAGLPDSWLQRPWEAPAALLAQAGVRLGRDYPRPILDLEGSRQEALARWERLRAGGAGPEEASAQDGSRGAEQVIQDPKRST